MSIHKFPTPYRPRATRDEIRAHRIGDQVKAEGGSAFDAACASAAAVGINNKPTLINIFKLNVETVIRKGTGHPGVRARYGEYARLLNDYDLDTSIWLVNKWWAEAKDDFRTLGRGRLPVTVLSEMRLLLRMIRASEFRQDFQGILDFVASDRVEDLARSERALVHGA